MDEKTVLVQLGERVRPVVIAPGDGDDVARATVATCTVFRDVLSPADEIVLQLKDEEWGGIFIDKLQGDIPSQSVLKAVVIPQVRALYIRTLYSYKSHTHVIGVGVPKHSKPCQ